MTTLIWGTGTNRNVATLHRQVTAARNTKVFIASSLKVEDGGSRFIENVGYHVSNDAV